ncbi:MAG: GNAT family N-acetyltransferase [Ahrensia sp.]|nr:GNAT family N-acetyltransferase [Ahrensia sp.]|tara:strand:- start:33113 stop:33709 length:597 start_codon:yes stop_codon:yes gene_type:complete
MTVSVRPLTGEEVSARFEDMARLRIAVFRAFPYLYDGDMDYERRYLETYAAAPGAFVCGAFDRDDLVGMATASPLSQHKAEFAEPFETRGLDVDDFFYFGESVLLPAYRGQGVGVRFFEEREAEARRQGLSNCIFSAVIRRADHPLRPADYAPLDAFWRKRGYERIDGLRTAYAWKDIGEPEETDKPMEYWMRDLTQS